jgi:hypothetical protein
MNKLSDFINTLKNNFSTPNSTLITIFGLTYIIASFHRLLYINDTKEELVNLNLPYFFRYIIILVELIIGCLLVVNKYNNIIILKFLFLFLISGLLLIIYNNYNKIKATYKDLWTLQPNSLSFYYHLLYLFLLYLLINYDFIIKKI